MTEPTEHELETVIEMSLDGLIDELHDLEDDGLSGDLIRHHLSRIDLEYRFGVKEADDD